MENVRTNQSQERSGESFLAIALNQKWDYTELELETIQDNLQNCNPQQVKAIVMKCLSNTSYKPRVAEIVKAKREIMPETGGGIAQYGVKMSWDIAEEELRKAAQAYVESFTNSLDMLMARREGWERDFERFVTMTAIAMASMIYGHKREDNGVLWGWNGMAVDFEYRKDYEKLLRSNFSHVRRNGIDVMRAMPGGQIPAWREAALKKNSEVGTSDSLGYDDNLAEQNGENYV